MALTLPNPDMVFVPLDVLTAQEMNNLVANIQHIANQFPLATANIADTAITASKINFTAFNGTEMPIRQQEITLGFGVKATLTRCGRVVTMSIIDSAATSAPSGGFNPGANLPAWAIPQVRTDVNAFSYIGLGDRLCVWAETSGSTRLYFSSTITGQGYSGSGTWFAKNANV